MKKVKQGFLIKEGERIKIDHNKTTSILLNKLDVELLTYFKDYFKGKLLDAGCGEKPYELIYGSLVNKSIGVDVEYCIHEQTRVDVFASLDNLPFEEGEFDTALCTNVLEHVQDSFKAFSELSRVLKKGGYAIISIPFLYPLHEAPHDYYRYTCHGIRHQLEKNGLKVIKLVPLGGPGLFFPVYFNLFINNILKLAPLKKLNCVLQELHFGIYKSMAFSKLVSKSLPDKSLSSIISCGFFAVAVKE